MGNKYHVLHRHLSRLSRPMIWARSRRSLYSPNLDKRSSRKPSLLVQKPCNKMHINVYILLAVL